LVLKIVVCAAAGIDSDRPTSSAAIEAVALIFALTIIPPVLVGFWKIGPKPDE
jgi:hypothetical protein